MRTCRFRLPILSTSPSLCAPTASSFEAANPRHGHEWALFETAKLPPDKVLPGRGRIEVELRRASRADFAEGAPVAKLVVAKLDRLSRKDRSQDERGRSGLKFV
jgi:hypothetical protein